MARVGEEAAGVSEHAGEVAKQTLLREHGDLLLHAGEGVVEPPGVAKLHAHLAATLEGATERRGGQPVGVVEAVEDDARQRAVLLGGVKEPLELEDEVWLVTHGVKAAVGATLLEPEG